MKRLLTIGLVASLALLAGGCFETREVFKLNPDGSGMLKFEVLTAVQLNPMQGNKEIGEPEEAAKKTAQDFLDKSKGVDAWEDVSYKVVKDGRIYIAGTAYFKDVTKFETAVGGIKPQWVNTDSGATYTFVPEIMPSQNKGPGSGSGEKGDVPDGELSGDELDKAMLKERMEYQQGRPVMGAIYSSFKRDVHIALPGKIKGTSMYPRTKDGLIRINIDGEKILETFDRIMADDELVKKLVYLDGEQEEQFVKKQALRMLMNAKTFDPDVKVEGPLKPLLDYSKAVEKAKAAEDAMFEKLGLEKREDDGEKENQPGEMRPMPMPG